MHSIGITG